MSENKKIVLGFSGSLDSVVCAYLLKKQGYEVIGIGIQFHSDGAENLKERVDDNGKVIPFTDFQGVYIIEDLERVKKLADVLDITFYASEASAAYQDKITDRIVAARIGGKLFSPKVMATELIFEVLMQKAKVLGAGLIATGHYAKVVRNKSANTINVFVSNDLKGDQSYLLCSLARKYLEKLYLPLSDMRLGEVEKIANGLNLQYLESSSGRSLMMRRELAEFVAERAAHKLFKEGSLIDYKNDSILGDHEGIHEYGLGLTNIQLKSGALLDKELMVIGTKYSAGTVYLGYKEDLGYDVCILQSVKYAPGIDLSAPQDIFIKKSLSGEKVAGILYPHNNGFAEISFKEPQEGLLFEGEYLAFYNRSGGMGKILGSGEVRVSGFLENGKMRTYPIKKDERDDEPEEIIDIYRFKF